MSKVIRLIAISFGEDVPVRMAGGLMRAAVNGTGQVAAGK
jgi:hypothetical protein